MRGPHGQPKINGHTGPSALLACTPGGFFRLFSIPSFDLGQDLYLDRGEIFLETGLTIPKWPQLVLGYEHRYKDGQKSFLEWGSVTE